MFAQAAATSPASIWLVGAIVVGGGLVIGPLSAFLTVFITRREVETRLIEVERRTSILEGHVVKLSDKIEEEKHSIIAAGEERAVKLHERINEVASEIGRDVRQLVSATAELRGELRSQNRA